MIKLKRAYDPPDGTDGLRILVDRLWPRGVRKSDALVALWLKDLAPRPELRAWFGHDPARWGEFVRRYWVELGGKGDLLVLLKHRAGEGPVTLVYAARDPDHNHAVALRRFLEKRL